MSVTVPLELEVRWRRLLGTVEPVSHAVMLHTCDSVHFLSLLAVDKYSIDIKCCYDLFH